MNNYDYREGKKRIDEILKSNLEIEVVDLLPEDKSFTYVNGYKSWVSAIFVDIRDSTTLFQDEDEVKISKMVRSFTSEVIRILRRTSYDKIDDKLREIGIRGDCVYAIYSTPTQGDILNLAFKTFYINTFIEMLNTLLTNNNYPTVKVGVGLSSSLELVVKAGQKGTGISNNVWIGKAVTSASNLSSIGNKGMVKTLVFSELSYNNFIDLFVNQYGDDKKNLFSKETSIRFGEYYHGSVIITEFSEWISAGMKD